MKVVTFFNHKGGVGKTTIVFNTALALAQHGHSVLIVDADAQANATGLALGETKYETAINNNQTIWSCVAPLVTGAGDLEIINPLQIRDNVWIMPGDLRLSNFEAILPVGWTEALAGEARGFRVTSALYRLFQGLSENTQTEYIVVDLGPNISALNRSVLIGTDGFVVPLAPDLFSLMALPSVGNSIREWSRQWHTALDNLPGGINFALPTAEPKPLGYVSQQFSVYGNRPTAAFRMWLERLGDAYEEGVLTPLGMPRQSRSWELGALKNFASLIPLGQKANKALFELNGREARGSQYTRSRETQELFEGIADGIIAGLEQ